MDTLWQDIRFGVRWLLAKPATTLVAIATLAIGIGATTAIVSVVNGVLLRPLPFPEPDRRLCRRDGLGIRRSGRFRSIVACHSVEQTNHY